MPRRVVLLFQVKWAGRRGHLSESTIPIRKPFPFASPTKAAALSLKGHDVALWSQPGRNSTAASQKWGLPERSVTPKTCIGLISTS